jgi:hypothetical protein
VHCWEHRCTTGVCWGRCRHSSTNYEARGASGGKYKARIVIFRILAAVDRFSRIYRKAESHWGKLESRWGILESHWGKLKSEWGKIGLQARKIGFWARKIPIFPRDSLASGDFGVSFCYQICYHVRAWIYFVGLKYSQFKINHLSNTPSTKGSRWRNLQWCVYQECQGHEAELVGAFSSNSLLDFFILEKQLAKQNMFLVRSKLSITAYLFLVLYWSTSLQSLSFLKNIETFLCK